jgi:hypothetical protein
MRAEPDMRVRNAFTRLRLSPAEFTPQQGLRNLWILIGPLGK